MARRSESRYISPYTDGNAARRLEPEQAPKKKARLPRPKKQKTVAIRVDPLAACGILVAAVLMIALLVGLSTLMEAQTERDALEKYVSQLEVENAQLQYTYQASYDLEDVERAAYALGMVPSDQVKTVTITLDPPAEAEPTGWWEQVCAFFEGLFA